MVKFLTKLSYLFMMPAITWAYYAPPAGLGGVAGNMLEPVTVFSDFVDTACLIFGVGFLFAAVIKYVEHKRSPLRVTISTVVFLVVAGIVLVLLPFLPMLTGSGIPYSLIR